MIIFDRTRDDLPSAAEQLADAAHHNWGSAPAGAPWTPGALVVLDMRKKDGSTVRLKTPRTNGPFIGCVSHRQDKAGPGQIQVIVYAVKGPVCTSGGEFVFTKAR